MTKTIFHWFIIAVCLFATYGCGGDSSNSRAAQDLIDDTLPTVTGTTPTGGTVSILGGLTDLGDLLEPAGDHWYNTVANAINDQGIVVGHSLNTAFSWDPATEIMTNLSGHMAPYNDYYFRKIDAPVTPLIGFFMSEAVDLNTPNDQNPSLNIIGNSLSGPDGKRAFIVKDGEFIDLPPILDTRLEFEIRTYSEAVDINSQGEVVLTLQDEIGRHAYYWDGISYVDIELPTDFDDDDDPDTPPLMRSVTVPAYIPLARIVGEDAAAVAINENGHIAINSGDTAIFFDFNYYPDVYETLNYLPGATKTVAVDINDSAYTNNDGIPDGHIIGNSGNGSLDILDDDSVRGFFWDGGAMYPIDHLGGGTSVATDINNSDQVVGAAKTDTGDFHAYLWTLDEVTEKGVMLDLGTLGGANSYATAINEAGQVTGWSETGEYYTEEDVIVPIRHAFLWSGGVMYDLGTHNDFYDYPFIPSFPFSEGVAINADGEVAGSSISINNHNRGFVLTPELP